MSNASVANVVNVADAPEEETAHGGGWHSYRRRLTPAIPREGHLGVTLYRVPPGKSARV